MIEACPQCGATHPLVKYGACGGCGFDQWKIALAMQEAGKSFSVRFDKAAFSLDTDGRFYRHEAK